jgi:hypothetical protein
MKMPRGEQSSRGVLRLPLAASQIRKRESLDPRRRKRQFPCLTSRVLPIEFLSDLM